MTYGQIILILLAVLAGLLLAGALQKKHSDAKGKHTVPGADDVLDRVITIRDQFNRVRHMNDGENNSEE